MNLPSSLKFMAVTPDGTVSEVTISTRPWRQLSLLFPQVLEDQRSVARLWDDPEMYAVYCSKYTIYFRGLPSITFRTSPFLLDDQDANGNRVFVTPAWSSDNPITMIWTPPYDYRLWVAFPDTNYPAHRVEIIMTHKTREGAWSLPVANQHEDMGMCLGSGVTRRRGVKGTLNGIVSMIQDNVWNEDLLTSSKTERSRKMFRWKLVGEVAEQQNTLSDTEFNENLIRYTGSFGTEVEALFKHIHGDS